jgi:hypothetical protein
VKGWPWHTTVFAQWDATATLLNGDDSYSNRGIHVITMRWGQVCALDVFDPSSTVLGRFEGKGARQVCGFIGNRHLLLPKM